MNKFVSYDINPYVYISEKCEVEKANELANLTIHEKLEGYTGQVILNDKCYTVKYIDKVLIVEWETDIHNVVGYPIEDGLLLDNVAVEQLEVILGLCEDSMEAYVIKHTQPVQE